MVCTAMLFGRIDFELCSVDREQDVDVKQNSFLGQPSVKRAMKSE